MTMTLKGFFEDWDGEIVLSDIRNYKSAEEFVERAKEYVEETRGHRIPVFPPTLTDIKYNDEEWQPADVAEFEGTVITVYCSYIDNDNSEADE